MKLTKASVSGLAVPSGKAEAIFFDDILKGFALRLRRGGSARWIVQYQVGGHKQRRITIGPLSLFSADEARAIAKRHLAAAHLGHDPAAERQTAKVAAKVTLASIAELYLKAKADTLRRKSLDEVTRYLTVHWKPLHGMPAHRIGRAEVAARITQIAQLNGPTAAARARVALSALFAWSMQQGLADINPTIGTANPAAGRPTRDRVLTDAELAAVWKACHDDDYGCIVRLLILLGQRRQEVGGMCWSELELERGTWTIPGARTKNKRAHVVPLPPIALAIIRQVYRRDGRDQLFGRGARGFNGWAMPKRALDQRAGIAVWTLHDVRRSCATGMADIGIQPHIIEAVLNHVSGHKGGVAGIYNRSAYAAEKALALLRWADHIENKIGASERKIVPLRG